MAIYLSGIYADDFNWKLFGDFEGYMTFSARSRPHQEYGGK
jgi:hypothetical protein